jgi:uncharacterized membrane protein
VDLYYAAAGILRMLALAVGAAVIVAGIARGAFVARGTGGRGRTARQIGDHASLGLEFFVAATLLNLVLHPTLVAAAMTAMTIVIRKLLTFSVGLGRTDESPATGSSR